MKLHPLLKTRLGAGVVIIVMAMLFFWMMIQRTAMAGTLIPLATAPTMLLQTPTAAPAGTAAVAGVVVKLGTGEPLEGTTVELYRVISRGVGPRPQDGTAEPYTMTTGADGKFLFQRVQPGEYRLVALRTDGFVGAEYGQRSFNTPGTILALGAGQTIGDIRLTLTPTGSISGRVRDRDGEPRGRVRVQALKATYLPGTGQATLVIVQAAQTNDLGEYRLFWLSPGRYYISGVPEDPRDRATPLVNAPNQAAISTLSSSPRVMRRTLDDGSIREEVFIPTYFPTTPNVEEAGTIDLRAGESLGGIDLTVLPPIPTRRVRGRVIDGRTGQPAANASVQISPTELSYNPAILKSNTDNQGLFELSGVIPGDSYLSAITGSPLASNTLTALTPLHIGEADLQNLTLTLLPGFDIPVSVTLDGPSPVSSLTINLDRDANARIPFQPVGLGVRATVPNLLADGRFRSVVLKGVRTGIHRIGVTTVDGRKGVYIKSMRFGGVDVLRTGLRIDGPPQSALEILVGTDIGTVTGVVANQNREPLASVFVALIPNEPNRHRSELYSVVLSDAFGQFRLEGLAPGDYRIFAVEEAQRYAWQDSEFIRAYERFGKPVYVSGGSTQDIPVTAIPAGLP